MQGARSRPEQKHKRRSSVIFRSKAPKSPFFLFFNRQISNYVKIFEFARVFSGIDDFFSRLVVSFKFLQNSAMIARTGPENKIKFWPEKHKKYKKTPKIQV